MNALKSNIRSLAETKRLSLTEVAKKAGIAHSTLFRVMKTGGGQSEVIGRVAEALGVTPERLMGAASNSTKNETEIVLAQKDEMIRSLQSEVSYLRGLLAEKLEHLVKLAVDSESGAAIIPIKKAANYRPAKAS